MIGIDLVEVQRINEAIIKNENFLYKILTQKEIEYVNSFQNKESHTAGFFACKEAVMKALENCKKISFTDIEILHKESGKPYIKLYGEAKCVFEQCDLNKIEVSISQDKNYATAICVINKN